MANPPGLARNLAMWPKISVLELLCFDQSCRPMAWPRLRQGRTESAAVARPRRNELLGAVGSESLPTAWMQPHYSASGVGFSGGGSIPNVLAVMQVIEKLPVDATSATRPSSPMVFSAAAYVWSLRPLFARSSRATTKQVRSRASARSGVLRALIASMTGRSIPTASDARTWANHG